VYPKYRGIRKESLCFYQPLAFLSMKLSLI
jgi:hypothetical protein